ncbi:MAG: NUDIX hydrolase [Dehalococcoidia bacterium]
MTPTRTRRRDPIREAVSAGGVVYRRAGSRIDIVLVARPQQELWALPKGTPEPGENVEETAIREVAEETGLEVRVEREIGAIEYWYAIASEHVRVHKIVRHFLMTAVGGDVSRHDHEYDVVEWIEIQEAMARMSYRNECTIVERAEALIRGQVA